MSVSGDFQDVVTRVHRAKSGSYGNAWKRRGEVLSIVANIARKVDRIEHVLHGGDVGSESLFDTGADLLIYCLKYATFLADQDKDLARDLFANSTIGYPYSEGLTGFEHVLSQLSLTA